MVQAKQGDTVHIHYTGRLSDGTVFDSSQGRSPLEFTIGDQMVIPGFEEAVIGMEVGDSKTAAIPADQAYGQRDENLMLEVEKEQFPPDMPPQVGMPLQVQLANGQVAPVIVAKVEGDTVILDANHRLAGKDLIFDIQLVGIV